MIFGFRVNGLVRLRLERRELPGRGLVLEVGGRLNARRAGDLLAGQVDADLASELTSAL
jgi:hypothetical protein